MGSARRASLPVPARAAESARVAEIIGYALEEDGDLDDRATLRP